MTCPDPSKAHNNNNETNSNAVPHWFRCLGKPSALMMAKIVQLNFPNHYGVVV